MGVHFWDSAAQQVFGDRRGWSVEMFYISDPNSSQDVLARIGPEAVRLCEIQKHHEVILRVDWAPGQNIPPRAGGEALATATKEQFGRLVRQLLSEIATVCIEKNTHPIRAVIVGNESNLKGAPASEGGSEVHGECDQDPTSCDPIWYADVYKAVVQQLFPEDGAPIDDALILVAGMSPAAGASPVHSHGSSDFYLQVFERLASTEGSPKRPDGVAFHAYGNAGVNETGLESFVADVQMHRPVFEAVEPSTPFFITEMNTNPMRRPYSRSRLITLGSLPSPPAGLQIFQGRVWQRGMMLQRSAPSWHLRRRRELLKRLLRRLHLPVSS